MDLVHHGNLVMGELDDPIKVSIKQFYGIEINGYAVAVAQTALWIAESQMLKETEQVIGKEIEFLPLKSNPNIIEGNALTMDWESVVPKGKLNYIMGNPPFVGASMMTAKQKAEAVAVFGKGKRVNSIDYVGAWYHKAAAYIASLFEGGGARSATEGASQTHRITPPTAFGGPPSSKRRAIKAAFVSTNSITQGEQVAALWKKLLEVYKIHIDFAWRTFRWNSESTQKAAVHCVIIGFSATDTGRDKFLFVDDKAQSVKHINPYLIDAPDVLIESRPRPLCDAPIITYGNKPSDGGNLILSEQEKDTLLAKDKNLSACVRRYVGAKDYINGGEKRYCLWLKNVSPNVYRKNADVMRRLNTVREMRLKSSAKPTQLLADNPYLFFSTPQTDENYLCIPEVSSENRRYIPIGFMDKKVIASNKLLIVPGATLYHFGVLISIVHMAWTRTVTGRLEMRYQYSGAIVYNNFPWPSPTDAQKAKIEATAQGILDARAKFPDASLADLYDETTMPPELRKAHEANDKAVMAAYGFKASMTEPEIVTELMKLYQELTAYEKGVAVGS